jgi:16S rRNA (guanine527-N7)-methyltransferase
VKSTIAKSIDSAFRKAALEETDPRSRDALELYLKEVALWSGRVHLVGRNRMAHNIELLLLDSLLLLKVAEEAAPALAGHESRRIADIGSGAGFPGLVWKLVIPEADFTLFERRAKPQLFLERMIRLMRLTRIRVVGRDAGSFEEIGSFGLVVSKAAGRMNLLLPVAARLLEPGGAYITIKGRAWKRELSGLEGRGMRYESAVELPDSRGFAVVFRK